jgi:hypothetical protein
MPLLCDAWAVGTAGDYVADKTIKGGVWGGQRACIIFVDGSGRVMTVDDKTLYTVNRPGTNPAYSIWDLSKAASPDNWLAVSNFLLFPLNDGNP